MGQSPAGRRGAGGEVRPCAGAGKSGRGPGGRRAGQLPARAAKRRCRRPGGGGRRGVRPLERHPRHLSQPQLPASQGGAGLQGLPHGAHQGPAGRAEKDPRPPAGHGVRLHRRGVRRRPGGRRAAGGRAGEGRAGLHRPLLAGKMRGKAAGIQRRGASGPAAAANAPGKPHRTGGPAVAGVRGGDGGRIPGHQRPAGRPLRRPGRPRRRGPLLRGRPQTEHLPLPSGGPGGLPGQAGPLRPPRRHGPPEGLSGRELPQRAGGHRRGQRHL